MSASAANHLLPRRQRLGRAALVALLVVLITALHYQGTDAEGMAHLIHRELYFLPLILAGFWFGIRGGAAASLAITALYIPTVLTSPFRNLSVHQFGNLLQILLYNIVGPLVGWLRNREFRLAREKCRSEHLAAMGEAISCIAHDMKTPLTAIGGFIRQARGRLAEPEKADTRLGYAQAQVERMETMVLDMLAFARPLDLRWREESLAEMITEAVRTVAEKAERKRVELRVEVLQEKAAFCCDRPRLLQGMMNLLGNAIEATPAGGVVTLRGQEGQGKIVLEVIDQGEGVPEAERGRILRPFVTTKQGGTGLGLPIVDKITAAHGGTMEISDNPEGGAVFRLRLPVRPTREGHVIMCKKGRAS